MSLVLPILNLLLAGGVVALAYLASMLQQG
jgi:hypothetical protein